MFSQFFILNHKGDVVIFKDYRFDISKDATETFFKHILSNPNDLTPSFNIEGTNYLFIKKRGMYFVLTTLQLVSASLAFEFLNRISKLIQDYTAAMTEEALRLNFALVYELLDELMDYGYPQLTSTEALKPFVFTPTTQIRTNVDPSASSESILDSFINATTKVSVPSKQAVKPIHQPPPSNPGSGTSALATALPLPLKSITSSVIKQEGQPDEIYVDIWERLTVLVSANGNVLRNEINGVITMKSYLKGNPIISMALTDQFKSTANGGTVDDFSFHECLGSGGFHEGNVLNFQPPQGEFNVLKYLISSSNYTPFLINSHVDVDSTKNRLDLMVKIRSNYANKVQSNAIQIKIPVPKSTRQCTHTLDYGNGGGQVIEYHPTHSLVTWNIKKMRGSMETILRIRCITDGSIPEQALRKEIGPISLEFDIPNLSSSCIQIKFLKDLNSVEPPGRWIRYITESKSYVVRV